MIFRSYIRQWKVDRTIPAVIQYGKRDGSFTTPETLPLLRSKAPIALPGSSRFDVSIIIPTLNGLPAVKDCINSILLNTEITSYEIIVADGGSPDGVYQQNPYEALFTHLPLKDATNPLQLCNMAAITAKGRYLCFLCPESITQYNWLAPLVETLEKHADIGIAGSKVITPDGRLYEAGSIIYHDSSLAEYGKGASPSAWEYNYMRDTDTFSHAAILLDKKLWEKLKGFDETMDSLTYARADLAMRVRYQEQLALAYQPRSVVMLNPKEKQPWMEAIDKPPYHFYQNWQQELHREHTAPATHLFLAREHAKKAKIVLVIDRDIPTFSKDTGSRSTYQYMHFFKRHGYHVKLFPHKMRTHALLNEPFAKAFLEDGFEIISEKLIPWLQRNGKYIDYIYLNRPEHALKYTPAIRQYTKAFIIYQGHDLHYLRLYRGDVVAGKPDAEITMEKRKRVELDICRSTDLPCFFSQAEVDILHAEQVFFHATAIPLFLYDTRQKASIIYQAAIRHDIIFVAGFAHAPNIDAALWFCQQVFPLIRQSVPGIKLYLAGSNPPNEVQALAGEDIIVTGQLSENELNDLYLRTRLTVVPLRFGAGVKGKVIESLFNKVPVVTTSIGIEGINNEDSIITVADSAENLAESIASLYVDTHKLDALSAVCHPWINRFFSDIAAEKILCPFMPELTR